MKVPTTRFPAGTMAAIASGEVSLDDLEWDEEGWPSLPAREDDSAPFLKPTRTRERLAALRAWADAQPWPGRTGTTDKLVYGAALSVAVVANGTSVDLSVRRLQELTGVAFETARRSLRRLVERGLLLRLDSGGEPAMAANYRVVLQNEVTYLAATTPSSTGLCDLTPQHLPDAFRTKDGLSKTAFVVLSQLEDGRPQTAAELAKSTGKHRSTVGRVLRQLAKEGLALHGPKGWRRQPADLHQLAVDLGTAGATERMRQRHATQREGFRRYLERVGATP